MDMTKLIVAFCNSFLKGRPNVSTWRLRIKYFGGKYFDVKMQELRGWWRTLYGEASYFRDVTIICGDNRSKGKCVKMRLDDAGCAYSPGAGVCEHDLTSSGCLRFHFAPADALKSWSFPYWVKDTGKVPISIGTRVFQALLLFSSFVCVLLRLK
jgi:hypothetical protein